MTDTISKPPPAAETAAPPFAWGLWSREIDVRDFIQQHVTPYDGDESFLAGPTARTTALWDQLQALFLEERKKGVLDISQIPSTIIAHEAGYIDKDNEIIVGLQTEAPLKRAIMPNGGWRVVENSLKPTATSPTRGGRDLHQVPQDPQRRRVRRLYAGRSAGAARRTS
jgi:formate C-acetyltransferase